MISGDRIVSSFLARRRIVPSVSAIRFKGSELI